MLAPCIHRATPGCDRLLATDWTALVGVAVTREEGLYRVTVAVDPSIPNAKVVTHFERDLEAEAKVAAWEKVREAVGYNPLTRRPWMPLSLHQHADDLDEAGIHWAATIIHTIADALEAETADG